MKAFDLHCDTIGLLELEKGDLINDKYHISLDRMGVFDGYVQSTAIFMPDEFRGEGALQKYDDNLKYFYAQMEKHADRIEQARTGAEITEVLAKGKVCAVLTVEGGSALAGDITRVEKLKKDGVAYISLTWNGKNEIAGGIGDPDVGITDFGREAIAEMERCGIIVDVSHLCDKAMDDLMKIATKPYIATHSNSRAVCNVPRNLRDDQFQEIVRRGGLVGINYFTLFLREKEPEKADFTDILKHVEHFLKLGGENVLALGSDYDGADIPACLNSVEKVADMYRFMLDAISDQKIVDKMFFENANRFMQEHLK